MSRTTKLVSIALLKSLIIIGVVAYIKFINRPFPSPECKHNEMLMGREFSGYVSYKKKSFWDNNSGQITMKNLRSKHKEEFTLEECYFTSTQGKLYNRIEVGDMVSKEYGTLLLVVQKWDSSIVVNLALECDESRQNKKSY
ncbi:MAG: hypothetical protein AAGI23_02810 [Bacteroidota bacterium]